MKPCAFLCEDGVYRLCCVHHFLFPTIYLHEVEVVHELLLIVFHHKKSNKRLIHIQLEIRLFSQERKEERNWSNFTDMNSTRRINNERENGGDVDDGSSSKQCHTFKMNRGRMKNDVEFSAEHSSSVDDCDDEWKDQDREEVQVKSGRKKDNEIDNSGDVDSEYELKMENFLKSKRENDDEIYVLKKKKAPHRSQMNEHFSRFIRNDDVLPRLTHRGSRRCAELDITPKLDKIPEHLFNYDFENHNREEQPDILLPPPPPSLLDYISRAASAKMPAEEDHSKSKDDADEESGTSASSSKTTHPQMNLSALVGAGIAVEEVLTATLMPLAKSYISLCRSRGEQFATVLGPAKAVMELRNSSVDKNNFEPWLVGSLPSLYGSKSKKRKKHFGGGSTFPLDERTVKTFRIARSKWLRCHQSDYETKRMSLPGALSSLTCKLPSEVQTANAKQEGHSVKAESEDESFQQKSL